MSMKEFIYLDHAAATPLDEQVLEVMLPYFSERFYNPSSPYLPSLEVRREYEAAKHELARAFGGRGDELIMTAGATESINLAISSIGGHIVTSTIEHHSVIKSAAMHDHTLVGPNEQGLMNPADIEAAITPETRLVSIAFVNNELGTIQPLSEIARIIKEERSRRLESGSSVPIYLHSDASQGVGMADINTARLGVDLLTLNAGKIYGPKQVGLLWAKPGVELTPVISGGGQERGLRSGTENVAGVMGFSKAIQLATKRRNSEVKRLTPLRDGLRDKLVESFPQAVVSGSRKRQLANYLHISFPGIDGERMIFRLESRGVLVATGSACAANKGTRSKVLEAIGMPPEVADGSLRITLGKLSNEDNIATAADILIEELKAEYERSQAK